MAMIKIGVQNDSDFEENTAGYANYKQVTRWSLSYTLDRASDIQIVSFSNRHKKGLFEKLSRL